ncbi:nucleotidyltransferase domain-containing protein [Patescibacteria group bacterium]|nr:nucleotidyltransferase domain-containing protein [Patescibacteria group bacterium]
MTQQEKDLQIAHSIKQKVEKKLKDNLISITFYGSRANGTGRKDSDLDLFVLVKNKPKLGSIGDETIIQITTQYLNQENMLITPVVYDLKTYQKYKNLSYLKEVRKGIKL